MQSLWLCCRGKAFLPAAAPAAHSQQQRRGRAPLLSVRAQGPDTGASPHAQRRLLACYTLHMACWLPTSNGLTASCHRIVV